MLGMIAENLAAGLVHTVQWHELEDERRAGAAVVDVRTPAEFAAGTLPGAINLPLDELRGRHTELPPGRLVVGCAAGQRGNVAARLLTQLGHGDVANLDGGYRTWQPPARLLARRAREDSTTAA
jgi:rhodanese-related sulfurtransferase